MIYKVWADYETEEDALKFNTSFESTAVEEWAKLMDEDSGCFDIANGRPITVWVLNIGSGVKVKLVVFGQFTPTYTSYMANDE
jgi:hypothetical protein